MREAQPLEPKAAARALRKEFARQRVVKKPKYSRHALLAEANKPKPWLKMSPWGLAFVIGLLFWSVTGLQHRDSTRIQALENRLSEQLYYLREREVAEERARKRLREALEHKRWLQKQYLEAVSNGAKPVRGFPW
jgi:hypothetical protein